MELEAPRRGGRVDVLATKASESVAIEIETGKSDVVSNVKRGLLSRFYTVLEIATSTSRSLTIWQFRHSSCETEQLPAQVTPQFVGSLRAKQCMILRSSVEGNERVENLSHVVRLGFANRM